MLQATAKISPIRRPLESLSNLRIGWAQLEASVAQSHASGDQRYQIRRDCDRNTVMEFVSFAGLVADVFAAEQKGETAAALHGTALMCRLALSRAPQDNQPLDALAISHAAVSQSLVRARMFRAASLHGEIAALLGDPERSAALIHDQENPARSSHAGKPRLLREIAGIL